MQREKSDFLQRATSATSNEQFCNEQRVILQRVTSNEWISTSNEQRVESYASKYIYTYTTCDENDSKKKKIQ